MRVCIPAVPSYPTLVRLAGVHPGGELLHELTERGVGLRILAGKGY